MDHFHQKLNEQRSSTSGLLRDDGASRWRANPNVITLESQVEQGESIESLEQNANAVAVMTAPPKTQYAHEGALDPYARKATRLAIRHTSGDRVVGFIEIVSPGNKQSQGALSALFDKLADAMGKGCHLLVIDLHPPTKRDPRGLHAEFWSSKFGDKNIPGCDAAKPLGMSAYHSTYVPKAYFQPFSVGDVLIDMPVFLTQDHYVNVSLEPTYLEAWNGVPRRWRNVIEANQCLRCDAAKARALKLLFAILKKRNSHERANFSATTLRHWQQWQSIVPCSINVALLFSRN